MSERAALYVRASTREQAVEGLTLGEQKTRLAAEADRREWEVGALVTDTKSGKRMEGRELALLLDRMDRGEFTVLLVTRLDRIARSLIDFLPVLERSTRHGWQLVMLDPSVDTTTPYGRAMAQMAGVFAELEGALISQRTREGLAYARARGTFRPGEHCRYDDRLTISKIMRWHRDGHSASNIAARLQRQGTPTPGQRMLMQGAAAAHADGDPERAARMHELAGGERAWHARTINRIITREKA